MYRMVKVNREVKKTPETIIVVMPSSDLSECRQLTRAQYDVAIRP